MKTFTEWLQIKEAHLDNRSTEEMFQDAIEKDGGTIGHYAKTFYQHIMRYSPEELPKLQAIVRELRQMATV